MKNMYIFGWGGGCAAGTLTPLPYTRPCSAAAMILFTLIKASYSFEVLIL